MARSPRQPRRSACRALAASAVAWVAGLTIATPTQAQLSDGTFALVDISAFGTDDGGRSASLPFIAKLGDTFYGSVFVNNNGLISFDSFISAYTTDTLTELANGNGQAVVAPFFADVDTTKVADNTGGQGKVGSGTVDGRLAFIATWDRVGRSNEQFDLLSSFEVLFIDRSDAGFGDFDIVFNYGQIEWTVANAGDVPARVGFALPDGDAAEFDLFDALPEETDGLLAPAVAESFSDQPTYITADSIVLEVRDGVVQTPDAVVVPTPTAAAAGLLALLAIGSRRRRA